jgi:hypothetical protein
MSPPYNDTRASQQASPKPRVKMTIDMLPLENVKHIFHFLDARSLVRSEMVCPAW